VNGDVIPRGGFFAFVSLQPAGAFLPQQIDRDQYGAVILSAMSETTMPGVFAAGTVRAGCGSTIEDAVGDGVAAARAALAKLRHHAKAL